MVRFGILAMLAVGCAGPSGEDGTTEAAAGGGCKHVAVADALKKGGTGFDAQIDSTTLRFCDGITVTSAVGGTHRALRIVGSYGNAPGTADDGASLTVQLTLDSARLTVNKPLSIAGEVSFESDGPYSYAIKEQAFAPSAASSPAITDIAVTFGCFCTLYGKQKQTLSGTVTLEEVGDKRLKGKLHLDLRGNIPFWNNGFAKDATAVIDVAFDAT